MPKVVMLLSNPFRPDVRVHKEARTLVKNGYDVEIIAWDRDGKYPREEVIDGIKVTRYRRYVKWGDLLPTFLGLILFRFHAFLKLIRHPPDFIHCHDFDTLAPGVIAGKLESRIVVYDAHELYPEMVANKLPPWAVGMLKKCDSFLARRANAVICVSMPLAQYYGRRVPGQVEVVMNCPETGSPDTEKVDGIREKHDPGKDRFMVLYLGGLDPGRMVDELADMFSGLENDFVLVMGGFGTLEGNVMSKAKASENVHFIGRVRYDDALAYNSAADVLVAMYDPKNVNNRMGAPNKLFEAMMAGKPVLVSRDTYAATIAEEENCGIPVRYGSKGETLEALEKLRSDKGLYESLCRNSLEAAKKRYNWNVMEGRLLKLYKMLKTT
ncbi:MAG: glycosyltransferase family 4 protein [Thermoplasmata archaeon]|nr:glycosyltransferase family 4 protein [Thermoplasmata archaeon]